MGKQIINVGTSANDGTGDKNRVAFQKINANFTELYDGEGSANLISTDPDNAIELGTDGKLWSGGGGGSETLQQVTDNGNTTTNEIISTTGLSIEATASGGKVQRIVPTTGISDDQNFTLPNRPGGGGLVIADDIPTDLSELNDDSTHRLVTDTQISTWDSLISGTVFQSVWNASTNTPTLTSSTGTAGHYYIVNVDGTTDLDGITDWKVGDWAIFDGTVWRKVDNTDAISSFNGRTGAITLLNTDVLPLILSGLSAASGTFTSSNTILEAFGKIKYLIDNVATTYQAILTETNFGSFINGLTAKNTLVDADEVVSDDSADSNKAKKTSWLNVWLNYLKPKADALYAPLASVSTMVKLPTDVTSTITTETVVSSFTYAVSANTTYVIRGRLALGCNGAGGVNLGTKFPSGAVINGNAIGRSSSSTAYTSAGFGISGTLSGLLNSVNSQSGFAFVEIVLSVGSTAGDFELIFASVTAGQTSTVIAAGSYLEYIKL